MRKEPEPAERIGYCAGCQEHGKSLYRTRPSRYRCASCARREGDADLLPWPTPVAGPASVVILDEGEGVPEAVWNAVAELAGGNVVTIHAPADLAHRARPGRPVDRLVRLVEHDPEMEMLVRCLLNVYAQAEELNSKVDLWAVLPAKLAVSRFRRAMVEAEVALGEDRETAERML